MQINEAKAAPRASGESIAREVRARRGPAFMGIGAQKAGTTWLHRMLALHPEIGFPRAGRRDLKEIHFWDKKYDQGIDWYLSLFDAGRIMGDITPAYAVLPLERIREIHAVNEGLRIIYILRNPIERAWSAALMTARRQQTGSRQSGHVDLSVVDRAFFIRHFASEGSSARGRYADCLRAWLQVFPREAFLVARYEQIQVAPRELLGAAARHISVAPQFYEQMPDELVGARVFSSEGEALPRELYEHLLEKYRASIVDLERLLGWDLRDWLKGYDAWREASGKA